MKQLIAVTKALADPNRVLIMKMLSAREMCVCEITAVLELSQPTVSKHLKVLEGAGLVESRRNGPWTDYRPAAPPAPAAAIVEAVLAAADSAPETRQALLRAAGANRDRLVKSPLLRPFYESEGKSQKLKGKSIGRLRIRSSENG